MIKGQLKHKVYACFPPDVPHVLTGLLASLCIYRSVGTRCLQHCCLTHEHRCWMGSIYFFLCRVSHPWKVGLHRPSNIPAVQGRSRVLVVAQATRYSSTPGGQGVVWEEHIKGLQLHPLTYWLTCT